MDFPQRDLILLLYLVFSGYMLVSKSGFLLTFNQVVQVGSLRRP
jgi:hypothetical protein